MIENARIEKVTLSMADHGCLSFHVVVEMNGAGVAIGGYVIGKGYLGSKTFTASTGAGLVAMMRIMDVVGVERWEDLEGKYCRIESNGWGSRVTTIGNIIADKWFDLEEFFEKKKKKLEAKEEDFQS